MLVDEALANGGIHGRKLSRRRESRFELTSIGEFDANASLRVVVRTDIETSQTFRTFGKRARFAAASLLAFSSRSLFVSRGPSTSFSRVDTCPAWACAIVSAPFSAQSMR